MATIIAAPNGMVESKLMTRATAPIPSNLLSKRNGLKDMLVDKLVAAHGNNPIHRVVIVKEVERLLKTTTSGKLSAGGLASLEKAVAEAVRATQPGPMVSHAKARQRGAAMSDAVQGVANWTDVAEHRASYYLIEQQRNAAAYEARKVELRHMLAHQMSQERHIRAANRQVVAEEAKQVADNLREYHADMAEAERRSKDKSAAQKRERDAQLREKGARAAAAERLRKLENEELSAHLRKEQQIARERAEAKQRANEEYHRETKSANVAAQVKREEQQQTEWAEELKLNAEWKAMLDKQEADRTGQYERLRERIRKMQRTYESNAGATDKRREEEEEERRERYIREEEARLTELDRKKRADRQAAISNQTSYLFSQMAEQDKRAKAERKSEEQYAASVRSDVKHELQREEDKITLRKARAKQQSSFLNEQVTMQKAQAARDPAAADMTDLEATLNRSLLVSIVQHKYPNPHVLN